MTRPWTMASTEKIKLLDLLIILFMFVTKLRRNYIHTVLAITKWIKGLDKRDISRTKLHFNFDGSWADTVLIEKFLDFKKMKLYKLFSLIPIGQCRRCSDLCQVQNNFQRVSNNWIDLGRCAFLRRKRKCTRHFRCSANRTLKVLLGKIFSWLDFSSKLMKNY